MCLHLDLTITIGPVILIVVLKLVALPVLIRIFLFVDVGKAIIRRMVVSPASIALHLVLIVLGMVTLLGILLLVILPRHLILLSSIGGCIAIFL